MGGLIGTLTCSLIVLWTLWRYRYNHARSVAVVVPPDLYYHRRRGPSCPLADLDLLLPLHHKDAALAAVLFTTLEKNMPCYRDLIVVVPPESEFMLAGAVPSHAKVYVVPHTLPPQFGYLDQQVVKIFADHFTTAPRVLILEADLVLLSWRESCFFGVNSHGTYNGKSRAYCVGQKDGAGDIWFKGTGHALGVNNITMDCCANTPFAFPREVFPAFRNHIRKVHGKTMMEFVSDYFAGHSKGWESTDLLFSEFNMLNHYMVIFRPDLVELVTPDDSIKFEQGKLCSRHVHVERNHALENPKLTSEYFRNAYGLVNESAMTRPDERRSYTVLDLTSDV